MSMNNGSIFSFLIEGRKGNDVLVGGAGDDDYIFSAAETGTTKLLIMRAKMQLSG